MYDATATPTKGICVADYEPKLNIEKGAWDKEGEAWTAPLQKNTMLYFENVDSPYVPNEPVPDKQVSVPWAPAHAWKFVTYVYPTSTRSSTPNFRIYPDDGARIFVYWFDTSLEKAKRKTHGSTITTGRARWACARRAASTATVAPSKCRSESANRWYKLEIYLYNDPYGRTGGGDEDGGAQNPLGLRIEDYQAPRKSLLEVLGTGSFANSEPPGFHNVKINGSETIYANQGLVEVRDFKMFSTDHINVECNSTSAANVRCSLRAACGNSEYEGLKTNTYGWILNHRLYPDTWPIAEGKGPRP